MKKYDTAYALCKGFLRVMNLFKPPKVYGAEYVPEGGAVICANHVYFSDPFYIITAMPKKGRVRIMGKEEIHHWPVIGPLLDWFDVMIWVKRGKADVGAIKAALKTLKGQEKLLIFPEGTRNDELGEGKTGAVMLAIRSGVPVLPVSISRDRGLFRPVEVHIGPAYHPFTEARKATTEDYQVATEALMGKIRALASGGEAAP